MDHRCGEIGLIAWQGRRNRRLKTGISLWAVFLVICALTGAAGLAGQVAGWLPMAGAFALLPAALVLLAICAQLAAVVRAALSWLAG